MHSETVAAPPPELVARDEGFAGRTWAIDQIGRFSASKSGSVLAVLAKPGIGKTALAVRLTRIARGESLAPHGISIPSLHAAHFCRSQEFASIDAISVIEHLASQLGATLPGYNRALEKTYTGNRGLKIEIDQRVRNAAPGAIITAVGQITFSERDPRLAFETLIRRPIEALRKDGQLAANVTVLIDGLDESADSATSATGRTLVDLLAVEFRKPILELKWILTTRAGHVISRLSEVIDEQLDLAGDAPDDVDDLLTYAEQRLSRLPLPDARRLAHRIADKSEGNFLYAYHVINDILAMRAPPSNLRGIALPDDLMGVYREFLDRKVGLPGEDWERRVRPVLGALTQARGAGLTRDQLVKVTGLRPSQIDDTLSMCAPYLAGSRSGGAMIYHQSLRDYMRLDGPHHIYPAEASALILDRLIPRVAGQRRWDQADPHVIEHGIHYAIDSGYAAEMISDPGFLVHAEHGTLLSALDGIIERIDESLPRSLPGPGELADHDPRLAAAVYRTSAHGDLPPQERRHILALDAARWGHPRLAARFQATPVTGHPLPATEVQWATGSIVSSAQIGVLAGHAESVSAVAVGNLDGQPIAVTGSDDSTVRIWDLNTRASVGAPFTGHSKRILAVAVGDLDGRPIAISGGRDGIAQVWDLRMRDSIGTLSAPRFESVHAIALGDLDGLPIAVIGSGHARVQVWDLRLCIPIGPPLTTRLSVYEVALGEIDGVPIVAAAGHPGRMWIWDLRTHARLDPPLTCHRQPVTAIALGQIDGIPIAVTGGWDETVRIWDLRSRARVGTLKGHTGQVYAIALGQLDGIPIAVTCSQDKTIRIWDLRALGPLRSPLTGHSDGVGAVAIGQQDDGRAVVVSGSSDTTARIWELANRNPVGSPQVGHSSRVTAIALGRLDDGRTIALSGAGTRAARIWDLSSHSPIGGPLTGHYDRINSVAVGHLNGQLIGATGSEDCTVRIWDLRSGAELGSRLSRRAERVSAVALGDLDGLPIALTVTTLWNQWFTERTTLITVWDLHTRAPFGVPLDDRTTWVRSVSLGRLDARPIAVTGSQDKAVRVWDLRTRRLIGNPLTGHTDVVNAVAVGQLDGRPIAVTASRDKSVRIWDLRTHTLLGSPLSGHTGDVTAVAVAQFGQQTIVVTGSDDKTVRIWDLTSDATPEIINLPESPAAVALDAPDTVLVALGYDIAVYRINVLRSASSTVHPLADWANDLSGATCERK